MKILHVHVALYQPWLMSRALRRLGYQSDCLIFGTHGNEWLIHGSDYDLGYKTVFGAIKSACQAYKLAKQYDVLHFHSLMTMLPMVAFRMPMLDRFHIKSLKKAGKRIVVSHWGCHDGIRPSIYSKFENKPCDQCNAYNGMCTDEYVIEKCRSQLEFADIIINHEPGFEDFNARAVYIPGAIDTDFWRPDEPVPEQYKLPKAGDTVYILHAFGNSAQRGGPEKNVKGTSFITDAVDRLKSEGYKAEFIFFDNIPNEIFKYYQLQGDVVVDQLFAGWYGSFARECMALGKPVLGYIRKDWLKQQPYEVPVLQIDCTTIYDTLKKIISDKKTRDDLGRKSRRYAEEVLDMNRVAKQLIELYQRRS